MSERIRVLVVDEDRDVMDLTRTFLERADDVATEAATTGADALDLVEAGGVDAVVTDYRMPGMDGLELAREVADVAGDVPVVVFSAVDDEKLAEAADDPAVAAAIRKRTGTDHYDELVSAIRDAVGDRAGDA